jgi:hypothetical protein
MLEKADELLAWMKANGVFHAKVDGVELTIAQDLLASPALSSPAIEQMLADTAVPSTRSVLDDPDLYADGVVPKIKGRAPRTPKVIGEEHGHDR